MARFEISSQKSCQTFVKDVKRLSISREKTPSFREGMRAGILSVTSPQKSLKGVVTTVLTENVPQREQSEKPEPRCADEVRDTRKGFDTFGNERVSGSMSGIGAVSEPAQNRGSAAENTEAFKVRPRKPRPLGWGSSPREQVPDVKRLTLVVTGNEIFGAGILSMVVVCRSRRSRSFQSSGPWRITSSTEASGGRSSLTVSAS